MREKRLITVADSDLQIRGGGGGHPDPEIRGGGGGHPDPEIRGGGGGHPDPEIRKGTGLKKNFFGSSGLSLVSNQGGPSPGFATRLVQKFGLR